MVTMTASVFLIIELRYIEGNAAAPKPQPSQATQEENYPSESSFTLVNTRHSCLLTIITSNFERVIRPHSWVRNCNRLLPLQLFVVPRHRSLFYLLSYLFRNSFLSYEWLLIRIIFFHNYSFYYYKMSK